MCAADNPNRSVVRPLEGCRQRHTGTHLQERGRGDELCRRVVEVVQPQRRFAGCRHLRWGRAIRNARIFTMATTNPALNLTEFSWLLHPCGQALPWLRDEFAVGAFKLILNGDNLRLVLEGSQATTREHEAREVAETYVKALGPGLGFLRLMSSEEFASLPAYASDDGSAQFPHTRRVPRNPQFALRQARNKVLASGDPTLGSCYNYIQDAAEHPKNTMHYLYKATEAIERRFGSERATIKTLNVGPPLKNVKRLANEHDRDERHAPSDPTTIRDLTASEKDDAFEDTKKVVGAYENYLRSKGLL